MVKKKVLVHIEELKTGVNLKIFGDESQKGKEDETLIVELFDDKKDATYEFDIAELRTLYMGLSKMFCVVDDDDDDDEEDDDEIGNEMSILKALFDIIEKEDKKTYKERECKDGKCRRSCDCNK